MAARRVLAVGFGVLGLAFPAAATAGTVVRTDASIAYDVSGGAAPEEITLAVNGPTATVRSSLGLTGNGCDAQNDPLVIDCPLAPLFAISLTPFNDAVTWETASATTPISARGGAGGDRLDGALGNDLLAGDDGDDTINGSAGNDTLDGGPGSDYIDDGAGDDSVIGGPGNDTWYAGPGRDAFSGGDGGSDRADYSARTAAVTITLDGVSDDGEAGEGDNASPDVEEAIGGSGPDRLVGNASDNLLRGGPGNDSLVAGAGSDRVEGEDGDDVIDTRDGVYDSVDCGSGTDIVYGDADDSTTGCELAPDPDGDGYLTDDCDQTNALIHPNAGEVPGNAVDEDCSNGPFYLRVVSLVQFQGRRKTGPLRAGFAYLRATDVRSGDRIELRCKGKGCPFAKKTVKVTKKRAKLDLTKYFKKPTLRPKARVEVRVLRSNEVGKVITLRVTKRAGLTSTSTCLPVGATKPVKCSTLPVG